MQGSTFIGRDVHKATISVAIAQGERGGEVRHWGSVPHRPDHIRKLVERLAAGGARLHFCYEAGPCGFGLHRHPKQLWPHSKHRDDRVPTHGVGSPTSREVRD
jgi:transposase